VARAFGENLRGHRRGATLHREERDGTVGAVGEGLSEAQQFVHILGVIEEEDRGSPARVGVETDRPAILAGQDKIRSSLTSAERSRSAWLPSPCGMRRGVVEFISIKSSAAKKEDEPGIMEGTADVPHQIAAAHLPP